MASREKELVKNTFVLALGRFLPKLVSVVTLPIVTARLTKSEYGTYDLIATLIMLLMPIATLQIQSAAFRFLIDSRKDVEKSSSIITNIYVVIVPISFIVSAALLFFLPSLSLGVRISIGIYFFFDSIESTMGQVTRGLGKNKEFSISSVLLSVINGIGIVCALSLMDAGLHGLVISLAIANIATLIYLCAVTHVWKFISISAISGTKIKELISYSWPMVPNNLSSWVLKLSDRMVITAALGVEANAVYAVANKVPNLLSIAQSVMVMAWQENASIAVKDKDADKYFTRMFDQIFSLMIGFTAVLIGFTPVMFILLIRGDYADAYVQMPILILGMFFYCMSAFQGGIYIAHKRTKSVGITTIVAAVINLVIDLLFVNLIGITAGSISTLIAYFVLYIYRMVDSQKFQPMSYNVGKQVGLLIFIAIMLFLCFLQNFYINIINMVVGIVAFLLLNKGLAKTMIKKIFSFVKRK